jgi:hypothetical protein
VRKAPGDDKNDGKHKSNDLVQIKKFIPIAKYKRKYQI